MELQRLEKYKTQFKYFDNTIQSLQTYLQKISPSNHIINPEKVSLDLSIPQLDVMFLLSLAEDEHLMKRKFFVYTKSHDFLDEFDNISSIPNQIIDKDTGKTVNEDNFYVNVVFEVA